MSNTNLAKVASQTQPTNENVGTESKSKYDSPADEDSSFKATTSATITEETKDIDQKDEETKEVKKVSSTPLPKAVVSKKRSSLQSTSSKNSASGSRTESINLSKKAPRKVSTKVDEPLKRLSSAEIHTALQSCKLFQTYELDENEGLENPIDYPRAPSNYKPPFRRNFRYFGYPDNLNLEMNTPPRVRSWGPIEEEKPPVKPKRQQFTATADESFDPYWTGRLLKSWTLLENPGLLPVLQKHKDVRNLGRKPVPLVQPDMELTNCPSDVYFSLTEKSRKAFCRINKIVQETFEKQLHAFVVQNPSAVKQMAKEETRKSDLDRQATPDFETRRSRFSLARFQTEKNPETLFYERNDIPPVARDFCFPGQYPGINKQVYARPAELEDNNLLSDIGKYEEKPITGIIRIPDYQTNIPLDIWERLSKISGRRNLPKKGFTQRSEKKFRTFNQMEIRNEVLGTVKEKFLHDLKKNIKTPPPPELYDDNRDFLEPPHDFVKKREYPPQGPFWWKYEHEDPATDAEQELIDSYIESMKDHHSFSHHLPGLLHLPRHPYSHLELDWIEPGTEMSNPMNARKTPTLTHEIPEYLMELDSKKFANRLIKMVQTGAKDLVGPEIYELYQRTHRAAPFLSPEESKTELAEEEMQIEKPKVKRRLVKKLKPKRVEVDEDEDGEDEEEEEEEEEEENEEEIPPLTLPTPHSGSDDDSHEYVVEADLASEEEFPLDDIRFSYVEFPKENIPERFKRDVRSLKREMERCAPITKDQEEEPDGSDSDTKSEDDEDLMEPPLLPRDSEMSNTQMDAGHIVTHAKVKITTQPHVEHAGLSDVFTNYDYTTDIDFLLKQSEENEPFLHLNNNG